MNSAAGRRQRKNLYGAQPPSAAAMNLSVVVQFEKVHH
jgi:hypothetical protein